MPVGCVLARLLINPGIVRNRLKVRSAVSNAQAFLTVQEEWGSFPEHIWNSSSVAENLSRRRA